jgi:hypothetical protein
VAGFIIFSDGRAWAPNNSVFDVAIERIAAAIPGSVEGRALVAWLLDQRSLLRGPGMGRLDLRTLTPANRQLVLDTMAEIFPAVPLADLQPVSPLVTLTEPIDWLVIDRFQLLGHMVAAARRGDSPEALNPMMRGLLPPTGERCGPGWDDNISPDRF